MGFPDFTKLFEDGGRAESVYGPVTLRLHEVGRLVLTTGRVVACDPAFTDQAQAYTVALPPGSYSAVLSVAHFEDGDQRVAAVMLRVGEGVPARWEMALLPGDDVAELGEGDVFGYRVYSAVGCLMDEEAAGAFMERAARDEEDFVQFLADAMDETYVDTWSWANLVLDPSSGLNILTFSAGFGDDLYASYFGRDARGEVCRLVTDFALFDPEELA